MNAYTASTDKNVQTFKKSPSCYTVPLNIIYLALGLYWRRIHSRQTITAWPSSSQISMQKKVASLHRMSSPLSFVNGALTP
jgi:hypothetical protein